MHYSVFPSDEFCVFVGAGKKAAAKSQASSGGAPSQKPASHSGIGNDDW